MSGYLGMNDLTISFKKYEVLSFENKMGQRERQRKQGHCSSSNGNGYHRLM